MSRTARIILTILAVAVATLAAVDVAGMPTWVDAILAALATGFAAVGIIPPNLYVRKDSRAVMATRPRFRPPNTWK